MKSALTWIARIVVGAVFVFAGVIKLRDPTAFAIEVNNYHFFPSLAPYVAVVLPMIEVVIGIALVIAPRNWARAAAFANALLLALMTIALAQVVLRGINVSCGCFGGDSGPVTWMTVLRDVALLAMSLLIYEGLLEN